MKRINDVWDIARWLGINVICILKGKIEMKEENIQGIIANVFFFSKLDANYKPTHSKITVNIKCKRIEKLYTKAHHNQISPNQ